MMGGDNLVHEFLSKSARRHAGAVAVLCLIMFFLASSSTRFEIIFT